MTIRKKTIESAMVRTKSISSVDLGNELHAVRVVDNLSDVMPDGSRREAEVGIRQGVVDSENLWLLNEGKDFEFFAPIPRTKGVFWPVFGTEAGLATYLGTPGFLGHTSERAKLEKAGQFAIPDRNTDFVALVAAMEDRRLVFENSYDGSICDAWGAPPPVAMHFEYIDAQTDNHTYHLERAVEVLMANPEIEFVRGRFDRGRKVNVPRDLIQSVPHYNQDEGRDECIEFIWKPSQESWNHLLEKVGFDRTDPKPLRLRASEVLVDADMFGLEKFRYESPACEIEKPRSETSAGWD